MTTVKKLSVSTIALLLSVWPVLAKAQPQTCTRNGQPVICNPLAVGSIKGFLGTAVDVITTLSVPVIVIMFIYSGFLFVTAGGDTGDIEDAKTTAMYAAIGAAIILGAQLITDVLINTAESLGVEGLSN